MTYHQADIRELEQPKAGRQATALMKFSAGSRSFLRYGYGDLLREDRRWGVVHRIWPGTQRLLLWGDPLTAAAHSRAFRFCGSDGVEICEPLSFKGRRGSGIAGDRCAYADKSLAPRWDWEKYEYSHRVWGRLLYNPDTDPDGWRRYLRKHFGAGAEAAEAALANSSRILPIVTTTHGTSAANNSYWPEVYLNQSMIDADHPGPYRDTPTPRVFGNVTVDGRYPVQPVTAQLRILADRDVGNINALGPIRQLSPRRSGRAIRFQRLLARRAVAGLVVNPVQDAAAEFRSEEAAQSRLDCHVDRETPVFRAILAARLGLELRQMF